MRTRCCLFGDLVFRVLRLTFPEVGYPARKNLWDAPFRPETRLFLISVQDEMSGTKDPRLKLGRRVSIVRI